MTKALSALLGEAEFRPRNMQCSGTCEIRSYSRATSSQTGQLETHPTTSRLTVMFEECLRSVESLIHRGLLVELSAADIQVDLVRWKNETLPVSWGVDRDRYPGDVDLTEQGFRLMESITQQQFPNRKPSPMMGYNNETPELIRVFGETEESCKRQLQSVVERINETPWRWPRGSFQVENIRPVGPWWYSRFERAPTGFEILLRRIDGSVT